MKTIQERAKEWSLSDSHYNDELRNAIECSLRELVEEIASHYDAQGLGAHIRRRFLGPPSAEEVVRKAWSGAHVRYFGQTDPEPMDVEGLASGAVKALREAGLLKEPVAGDIGWPPFRKEQP